VNNGASGNNGKWRIENEYTSIIYNLQFTIENEYPSIIYNLQIDN
jgi:hypothetical protein